MSRLASRILVAKRKLNGVVLGTTAIRPCFATARKRRPAVYVVRDCSWMTALSALTLKWAHNAPLVYAVRADASRDIEQPDVTSPDRHSRRAERVIIRNACRLVVGDLSTKRRLLKAGIAPEKVSVADLASLHQAPGVSSICTTDASLKQRMVAVAVDGSIQDHGDSVGRLLQEASFIRPRTMLAKRMLDVTLSAAALVATAVPMALVAGAVSRQLGRPVLFKQIRPGLHGQPFTMVKFRTMTDARSPEGELLPDAQRLTPFGVWLRRSSLDELPELWNVLRGDMSLVGPRPLLTRYSAYFRRDEELRMQVKPGITGLAQTRGRNELGWDARLKADAEYVQSLSLRGDIRILADTVALVLRRDGVVADAESVMRNLDVERAGRTA